MIQHLLALILLLFIVVSGAHAAQPKRQTAPNPLPVTQPTPTPTPDKSQEQLFLDGRACLQRHDMPCAQKALASIVSFSPYARILEAQIAVASGDAGAAQRLLIPLQTEPGLLRQAYASLHLTLAQAYAAREDRLQAVEQYVLAGQLADSPEEMAAIQAKLWELIAGQSREVLVEMRGESPGSVVQGWIDLVLAKFHADQTGPAIKQWRKIYPDHPAGEVLLRKIALLPAPEAEVPTASGKVALLLPLDAPDFAAAAQAVLAGFMSAHVLVGYKVEIASYSTDGTADMARVVYRQAVQDGAQLVVGPLARDELEAIISDDLVTIPTLSLNQPDNDVKLPEKMLTFGLPVENEARQVAQMARDAGILNAIVLVADTPSARRMAAAFAQEWQALGGEPPDERNLPTDDKLPELKADLHVQLANMIFLAADAGEARRVRPFLDPTISTYGISHIHDGDAAEPQSQALAAVHFVDMPWLLNPDESEFAPYHAEAAELGKGWPQRWFALGADAYKLLPYLNDRTASGKLRLHGLSGDINFDGNNRFLRELSPGQFRPREIKLESSAQ